MCRCLQHSTHLLNVRCVCIGVVVWATNSRSLSQHISLVGDERATSTKRRESANKTSISFSAILLVFYFLGCKFVYTVQARSSVLVSEPTSMSVCVSCHIHFVWLSVFIDVNPNSMLFHVNKSHNFSNSCVWFIYKSKIAAAMNCCQSGTISAWSWSSSKRKVCTSQTTYGWDYVAKSFYSLTSLVLFHDSYDGCGLWRLVVSMEVRGRLRHCDSHHLNLNFNRSTSFQWQYIQCSTLQKFRKLLRIISIIFDSQSFFGESLNLWTWKKRISRSHTYTFQWQQPWYDVVERKKREFLLAATINWNWTTTWILIQQCFRVWIKYYLCLETRSFAKPSMCSLRMFLNAIHFSCPFWGQNGNLFICSTRNE